MQIIKCVSHDDEFVLPIEENEYSLRNSHTKIELLTHHIEKYLDCRFEEVKKT